MVQIIEKQRCSRLARQATLVQVIKTKGYKSRLPEGPGIADICQLPRFSDVFDLPIEDQVTAADFEQLLRNVSTDSIPVIQWFMRRFLELESLIPLPNPSMLFLATVFFRCTSPGCNVGPMDVEEIVTHRCLTKLVYSLDPKCDDKEAVYYRHLGEEPWNYGGGKVEYHDDAATVASKLVSLYGEDPLVIDADTMADDDPMYKCGLCSTQKEWKVYPWSIAVCWFMLRFLYPMLNL